MKEKLKKRGRRKIRKIMKVELNFKNKIIALKSISIPIISYIISACYAHWSKRQFPGISILNQLGVSVLSVFHFIELSLSFQRHFFGRPHFISGVQ